MRSRKNLLVATAVAEIATGLGLLLMPALGIALLLGVTGPSPEALLIARVAGVALLAIGIACWFGRDDSGSASGRGVMYAVLVYDFGVALILAIAGATLGMAGVLLWPAVAFHAVMAVWCLRGIWAGRTDDTDSPGPRVAGRSGHRTG